MYILKKLIRTAEVILAVGAIAVLGTLDFLAWLLQRAATLAESFKSSLVSLLKGILTFIGKGFVSTVNMTETFIRYLLEQLFRLISSRASLAFMASLASSTVAAIPVDLPMILMGAL